MLTLSLSPAAVINHRRRSPCPVHHSRSPPWKPPEATYLSLCTIGGALHETDRRAPPSSSACSHQSLAVELARGSISLAPSASPWGVHKPSGSRCTCCGLRPYPRRTPHIIGELGATSSSHPARPALRREDKEDESLRLASYHQRERERLPGEGRGTRCSESKPSPPVSPVLPPPGGGWVQRSGG
jgi:hypothetical protein